MGRKILVAVAWPYANGDLHVGHLAGTYLPAGRLLNKPIPLFKKLDESIVAEEIERMDT